MYTKTKKKASNPSSYFSSLYMDCDYNNKKKTLTEFLVEWKDEQLSH